MTGGYETTGKKGGGGNGSKGASVSLVNHHDFADEEGATLHGIANEMINGNGPTRGGRSGTVGTTETSYEDAREAAGTPVGSGSMSRDNTSTFSRGVGDDFNGNSEERAGTPAMTREHSQRDEPRAGNQSRGSGQMQDMRESSHRQGDRASSPGQDQRGAGYANVSTFEQTDAASFIGQDPIAQAGDFAREDADIVFLSSEMGLGPNRQPMTRFKIHSVNLNVHSPVLSEMIDELEEDQSDLQLEEDSATLKLLFGEWQHNVQGSPTHNLDTTGLMYNRPAPSLGMNEWQVVLRLARCAQKYDISRAKEVAAAYFTEQEQLGALSPFMTYAFAVQYSE